MSAVRIIRWSLLLLALLVSVHVVVYRHHTPSIVQHDPERPRGPV